MRENFNRQVFESMPDSVYTGRQPKLGSSTGRVITPMRAAAAAVIAALAVSTTVLSIRQSQPMPMSESMAQAEITYKVNNSLQGSIVLPDSTLVTLNSGSTLTVADDFDHGTRTVYLDGEGYFDVRSNKDVPFYIKTPQDVLVKVTGTRFNVKCYSDDPKFDLTLLQGAVEVTTRSNEVIEVSPSEEIIINSDFHSLSRIDAPQEKLVWKEGILRFDHTPMSETLARIERWYGVDFVVEDDSIFRGSFTAEFCHETLSEVLDLLCITSRLEYNVDGGVVRLKKSTSK